jgi:hypothetical protein
VDSALKMLSAAALVATLVLPLTAGSASAVPITGNTSFTSTGTTNVMLISNVLSTFSFPLNVGGSVTQNVLTLTPRPRQRH